MKQPSMTRLFSEVSLDYANYRPSYPAEAIDKILEGFENLSQLMAVDVGAGTGIASRQLAERGLKVVAIESDVAMIEKATPHPRVEFRETLAQTTNLPDKCADIVTCFTAFHWFDFERSLQEFRRVLKPSGRLALIWNPWDTSDPFTRRYAGLIKKASKQYRTKVTPYNNFPSGYIKYIRINLCLPFGWNPYFRNVCYYQFAYFHAVNLAGLIGVARSQSFVPGEGPVWERLVGDLENLVESSEAIHHLAYKTKLLLAQPRLRKV